MVKIRVDKFYEKSTRSDSAYGLSNMEGEIMCLLFSVLSAEPLFLLLQYFFPLFIKVDSRGPESSCL